VSFNEWIVDGKWTREAFLERERAVLRAESHVSGAYHAGFALTGLPN